jgi:hypothetical protein
MSTTFWYAPSNQARRGQHSTSCTRGGRPTPDRTRQGAGTTVVVVAATGVDSLPGGRGVAWLPAGGGVTAVVAGADVAGATGW